MGPRTSRVTKSTTSALIFPIVRFVFYIVCPFSFLVAIGSERHARTSNLELYARPLSIAVSPLLEKSAPVLRSNTLTEAKRGADERSKLMYSIELHNERAVGLEVCTTTII